MVEEEETTAVCPVPMRKQQRRSPLIFKNVTVETTSNGQNVFVSVNK
jgi:hypothetical protein